MRIPIFRGKKSWGIIISGILLSSMILTACGSPSVLDTKGPVSTIEANLFWFTLIVATGVFLIVEFLLVYFVFRYRSRPGLPEPRQVHGNDRLELLWTAIPTVVLFGVLIVTIYSMVQLQQPAGPKLEIRAVGHQWWWEFDYPDRHIVTSDTLVVPANTVVQVDLVSQNVIHSFWVPALTGKTDVIPGHNNIKWFSADSSAIGSTFRGECAEYCGTQHAHMNFDVVVMDTNGFNTWVSSQQQNPTASSDPLVQKGASLFKGSGGCSGCHGIVGVNLSSLDATTTTTGLPITKIVGPNLTHFGSRHLIAGGVLTYNPSDCDPNSLDLKNLATSKCQLAQWLNDPQSIKPGNDMQISLTPDQVQALIAYLNTLK